MTDSAQNLHLDDARGVRDGPVTTIPAHLIGTVVVNRRKVKGKAPAFDVYIGRAIPRAGIAGSRWANPFKIGADGTRSEVVDKYRAWVVTRPDLMAALPELRDKVLACWCAPKPCHGDVLVELAGPVTTAAQAVDAST